MFKPTSEQQDFIDKAKEGKNVLVDACIGSGKTTAIQNVCVELPGKHILYLTYNRRLLLEARARIKLKNVDVHTFHSFAGTALTAAGVACSSEREAPQLFSSRITQMPFYDTVIVDEYQDLESNLADMLWHICYISWNMRPGFIPQFLIVGDMDQKIYDYTSFDARSFIDSFMSKLKDGYERVYFTQCFRLPAKLASDLGQAWQKSIMGVNPDCKVNKVHDLDDVVTFLSAFEPREILVLGGNNGVRPKIQNLLESRFSDKFNKNTVYSSTADCDRDMSNMDTSDAAIFTTYDSAKGLERPVCVVCDFTSKYLEARMKYATRRDILKNLFLVAASRGKNYILFYTPPWMDELKISRVCRLSGDMPADMRPERMSGAFDYKQHEDVDECLSYLDCKKVRKSDYKIETQRSSGMIDLSPCVGIYAQAAFFKKYDIDSIVRGEMGKAIGMEKSLRLEPYNEKWPVQKKILYLMALDTGQERYFNQIKKNYVDKHGYELLMKRLSELFDGNETVEKRCSIVYTNVYHNDSRVGDKMMTGRCDVLTNDDLYELKFVSKLKGEHMLQTALYVIAFGRPYGILWNLYDGEMYEVRVTDKEEFLASVCRCISKGLLEADTVRLPTDRLGPPVIYLGMHDGGDI